MLKLIYAVGLVALCSCAGESKAEIAKTPDVGDCRPLGEVSAPAGAGTGNDRLDPLQVAAAEKGATDVVVEDASGTSVRGSAYECHHYKTPSRSEQRRGM